MRLKFKKRIISIVLTAAACASVISAGSFSGAAAFNIDDLQKDDRMSLGFSIINGYSKLSVRKGLNDYSRTAVYSGLDLKNPYLMTLAGGFYLANGVDFERTIGDNSYAMELIKKLNGFLKGMWVTNDRAERLKKELKSAGIQLVEEYDTVGLYIVKTDKAHAERLMKSKNADFVFAGGRVPPSMKDLNMDGKSGRADIPLIQKYLARAQTYADPDENEYIKFAADINGDKKLTIDDVTELQK